MQTRQPLQLGSALTLEPESRPGSSLREMLAVLFRRRKAVLAFFLSVTFAAGLFTYFMPKTYRSDTKLLVKVGRESVAVDPAVVGPTMAVTRDMRNEINSEVQLLTSKTLAEKTVDVLGPEFVLNAPIRDEGLFGVRRGFHAAVTGLAGLADSLNLSGDGAGGLDAQAELREEAVITLMENLQVSPEDLSNVIWLGYKSSDPDTANKILSTLVDQYQRQHVDVYSSQAQPAFFESQLADIGARLKAKQQELEAFKGRFKLAAIQSQTQLLIESIEGLQNRIDETNASIEASQARIDAQRRALQGRSETIVLNRVEGRANTAAEGIKQQLLELRLREIDLSSRYADSYRPLVQVREQIRVAREALADEQKVGGEITTGIDPNVQALQLAMRTEQAELSAARARKTALEGQQAGLQDRLSFLVSKEREVDSMEREVELLKQDYANFYDTMRRAAISNAMDKSLVSNVSVIEPATLPMLPLGPRTLVNLVLGMFLGILGGIALAFLQEYFDQSLHTPDHVRNRIGLPVLASVSKRDFVQCI
ncbi:MAG: GumC family protein [Desulfocurvibacter africanus]